MMRRYRRRYGASRKGQIQPRMGMRPAGEPAGGQGIRIGTLRGVNGEICKSRREREKALGGGSAVPQRERELGARGEGAEPR